MARLRWFTREWNLASDDFVIPCVLYDIAIVVWTGFSLLVTALRWKEDNVMRIPSHLDSLVSAIVPFCFLVVNFCASTAVAIHSSRGTLMQSSKRKRVVTAMNVFAIALFLEGLYFALCATNFVSGPSGCEKNPLYSKLKTGCIVFLGLPIGFIVLHWKFRGDGNSFEHRGNVSFGILRSLIRLLVPKLVNTEKTALDKLGELIRSVFRDHGLTPSDVLAGIILLSISQRTREEPVENNNTGTNVDVLTDLQDFCTHTKHFIAAYGFALLPARCMGKALWSRLFMKLARKRSINQQTLYSLSISLHLKCSVEELVDYSSGGELCNTAFYVLLPRSSQEIVIAIRGTMSLYDCMTDLLCHPTKLSPPGTNNHQESGEVHFGMQQAALIIFDRLEENGILSKIGDLKDRPIVILGHSLGAGVATILSIFMESLPQFKGRVRCLAYAPPGGLLSPELARSTSDYVKAVFLGNDVVPRLSKESVEDLRTNIVQIRSHCHRHKTSVLVKWRASGTYMFGENAVFKELITASPKKLHPPANIIKIYPKSISHPDLTREPSSPFNLIYSLVRGFRVSYKRLANVFRKNRRTEGKLSNVKVLIRNKEYAAKYVDISDKESMHRIRVTPTMFTDHLPWKLQTALQSLRPS